MVAAVTEQAKPLKKPTVSIMRFLLLIVSIALFTSCVSNKELTSQALYFKNISDSLLKNSSQTYSSEIQNGDILYIGVLSSNESSIKIFNQQNFYAGAQTGAVSSNPAVGYLVNEKGEISFPMVGIMKVAGMNKSTLTNILTEKVRTYISDAVISVRIMNFKVTVLGEVKMPGSYSIPSERVTILDVLGLAGDLTVFGKRNNIRVIRETNGVRETGTVNLNDGKIFNSPYYFLRQNDIVYVEMNDRKINNADQTNSRNLSLVLGALSAISIIVTLATNL